MSRHVLVAGATGLVGRHLVRRLLQEPGVAKVTALVRRPLGLSHARLDEAPADFERLAAAPEALPCDEVFLALGTTIRTAGSPAAFRRVDHDYTLAVAAAARQGGATACFLVSSVGAAVGSGTFYLAVKGETEAAVAALGFPRLHIFRPSLLLGARAEVRRAERLGMLAAPVLNPLLLGPLAKYRAVAAETVAAAMVAAARYDTTGTFRHEHDGITRLAETSCRSSDSGP